MSDTLPEKMVAAGGMFNSSVDGNGLFFHHDGIAELAKTSVGIGFVANHSREIEDRAGTVSKLGTKRFNVDVPVYKRSDTGNLVQNGTRNERATLLTYEATLDASFPGYPKTAQSILAIRKAGGVPNVSVFIFGTGLSYDEEADRFYLEGPYTLGHLGHVDMGAMKPADKVGIFDVRLQNAGVLSWADPELQGGQRIDELVATLHAGQMSTTVLLGNAPEMYAEFAMLHAANLPLIEKLGKRLGLDTEKPPASPAPLDDHSAQEAANLTTKKPDTTSGQLAGAPLPPGSGNKPEAPAGGEFAPDAKVPLDDSGGGDAGAEASKNDGAPPGKGNKPEGPGTGGFAEKNATDPSRANGRSVSGVDATEFAALKAKLEAFEAEKLADKKAKINSKREALSAEFPEYAPAIAILSDETMLATFEQTLRTAKGNPLARAPPTFPGSRELSREEKDEKDRVAWLRSSHDSIGLKALPVSTVGDN